MRYKRIFLIVLDSLGIGAMRMRQNMETKEQIHLSISGNGCRALRFPIYGNWEWETCAV